MTIPVWLLVPVGLGLAAAGPVPTAKPATARKACHLERFLPMSPREMEFFKKAKDALEKQLLLMDSRCSWHLFPRTWDLQQLRVWERPVALQAELALTLKVLGNMTDPALEDVLEQPLHTLRHIHSHPESPGFLQASVTSNLFCLLIRDLRCVSRPDL
ncbi:PREDICTED: interferon lambda-2 [Chinchilla lanigera]|uniref:interferon lambda-2 n=1 Tax=Chinchilla lanigera TaxID=34839 RepID=UPI000695B441|nr:PREDICTED: interferon lambda-2 [Chinchilla lanigera]